MLSRSERRLTDAGTRGAGDTEIGCFLRVPTSPVLSSCRRGARACMLDPGLNGRAGTFQVSGIRCQL